MKKTIILLTLGVSIASSNAAVLYNIASFNNNGTTSGNWWTAGITTITTASGLTGTDDAGLLSLQTINPDPTNSNAGSDRFQNTGSNNVTDGGTLITDVAAQGIGGDGYFQFGITGGAGNINLTSLTFQGLQATGTASTRGYDIDISIDGGTYVDFAAAILANDRGDGLESVSIPMSNTGVSSVDFRVRSTGGGVEYTNFAINGDVVPEPSSAALLGLGGVALLLRRRK